MRVNMKGLTLWSFLMAAAHGAGIMVVPLFLGMAAQAEAACHAAGDNRQHAWDRADRNRHSRDRIFSGHSGDRGDRLRKSRVGLAAQGLDQPRFDLGCRAGRDRRTYPAGVTIGICPPG